MKKYCLLFITLLYVNADLLVKAAESSHILSFVNENEESPLLVKAVKPSHMFSFVNENKEPLYFVIGSKEDTDNPKIFAGSFTPGEQTSLPVSMELPMKLCLWPESVKNELTPEEIEGLKKIMTSQFDRKVSQMAFDVKPALILQTPPGFNRTTYLKFTQKSKLKPQEKKDGYEFSLDNNIKKSDIKKQVLTFSSEKDRWEQSNIMPFSPQQLRSRVDQETDDVVFKLKYNEHKDPKENEGIFIVAVNGDNIEARLLGSGEELIKSNKEFDTEKSTQLFVWYAKRKINGSTISQLMLDETNKEEMVKLITSKKIASSNPANSIASIKFDCNFGSCPPDYFISLPPSQLQFLKWKDGILGLQKIKKGFMRRNKSILGNVTQECINKNLLMRKDDGRWQSAQQVLVAESFANSGLW